MKLPLYRLRVHPSRVCVDENVGLWFDKYLEWEERQGVWEKITSNARSEFLKKVRDRLKQNQNTARLLEAYSRRRHKMAARIGAKILQGRLVWRLVSGLGAAHPLETGFVWHRTLGVPFLPGSSIKGMMRAWADPDRGWGAGGRVDELFGDLTSMGRIMIFDALPVSVPALELDIMNPHYAPYYKECFEDGRRGTPPADYFDPIPLIFLTVAPKARFEFMIAPVRGRASQNDLEEGAELLKSALETIGIGAKTAVGYGVFEVTDVTDEVLNRVGEGEDELNRQERQELPEDLSPEQRRVEELRKAMAKSSAQELEQLASLLYKDLSGFPPEIQVEAARVLKEVYTKLNKWTGKLSSKQKEKVATLKRILGE